MSATKAKQKATPKPKPKAKPTPKPKQKPKATKPSTKEPDRWFDKMLQLALLDEVMTLTERELEDFEAAYKKRAKGKRAPSWDSMAEQAEFRHNRLFEQLLLAQPISARDLATIDDLTLDGDRDIYTWLFPSWWEAGSHFTIHDLRDLARCPSLTDLHLGQGLVDGCSLAPLEDLPRLRAISMCTTGKYKDIEALVDLPSLQTIEVVNIASAEDPARWRATIDKLVARGVTLKTQ